jgi:quercetin dioxygenase-like cupin family protein
MISRRFLLEGAAGFLFVKALKAQGTGGGPKVIFKHDVPDLTMKNWSATAVEVSYGPGESSPAHRHPGITIAYVLEGEIRSKVGDEPEKTYTAGQMFLETPGQLHAVSGNASKTRPAKLLAILLADKQSQLTTPAQD